ncbi:energy transducer TonB [Hymenobacter monticola]|uniref:Energy transducer TonB n=1 Tax=Hymenobacter monticola TaxID=1705399 RepID=A0ABY4BBW9_9BACT|nr:energy transducer TonB [Hymenobacter monticola]UOE36650.1 energy transducer TonB [Hymenobacter monticola]
MDLFWAFLPKKTNPSAVGRFCALVLGMLLVLPPLRGQCQGNAVIEDEIKAVKEALAKNRRPTTFSNTVEDMYFDCAARKLASQYFSLTEAERSKVKKLDFYALHMKSYAAACINNVMEEVKRINKSRNVKVEVYREQAFKEYLKKELSKDIESDETTRGRVNYEDLCNCIYSKVKYTPLENGKLMDMGDPKGYYNTHVLPPCISVSLIAVDPDAKANEAKAAFSASLYDDVSGTLPQERIKTLPYKGTRTIAFSIGKTAYDGVIDSGASYLVLTTDIERELLLEGIIDKSKYLEPVELEVADGRSISVRRMVIPNIVLGGFTIRNVVACVVPSAKTILVGKSLLNKFRRWSFDNESGELLLDNRTAQQLARPSFLQAKRSESRTPCSPAPGNEGKVYTYVEQMPRFPGGPDALLPYILNALVRQDSAGSGAEDRTTGSIYVSFTVDCGGNVVDVRMIKKSPTLSEYLHNEVMRVVKSLPAFTPGKQNGRAVDVSFTMPITVK